MNYLNKEGLITLVDNIKDNFSKVKYITYGGKRIFS